jgi:light-regulated signal transduction histidine kinase (bacteriophytochrome)
VSNQARAETPVDLDTCEREPIHVPGAVQPHGVLLALSEPDLVVRQVSSNSASVVGLEPADLLGRRLPDVLAGALASAVQEASSDASDPTEHFPLSTDIEVRGEVHQVDALLHRTGDVLVVEIEPGAGPLTFDLTYRATRRAVGRINRAVSPGELYAIAAEEVRRLTGFDRVMVYRFDAEWNGQVVAEDKTDELNSFLGLRYPASDIPAQARALYTRSWLRVIPDVGYRPAPLVPVDDPQSGEPLDLSHSTLRSVSPIHIEYLQNMGVSASMSISLLDRGNLWGLIACHHYSGPHRPAYEVRAAAEFLGQALSLRLVESTERLDVARALEARSRLAVLTTAINDEARSAAAALTDGPLTVLDLVPATGVAVGLEGGYATVGEVPAPSVVRALVAQAQRRDVDVLALDSVPTELSGLTVDKDVASGALVLRLSADQFVVWLRPEQVRTVDWGGDPHNKEIAAGEGDEVRLSPRKSFDRWRETVRLRSEPWALTDVELAGALRANLLDALYARTRRLASVAEVLQRSLLPGQLPTPSGWELDAENSPTAGGDVGGDWYDAVTLPSGHLVCVLGDVAGHGISAAGTMGQLRNGLRAYLVEDESPSRVLARLSRLAGHLMPLALATATVVVVDLATGLARVASAGHPPVCHVPPTGPAVLLPVQPWPPLGAVPDLLEPAVEVTVEIEPGASVVLYSDGMVERRTESIDVGLDRLARLASAPTAPGDLCGLLMRECRDPEGKDDATILVLHRLL